MSSGLARLQRALDENTIPEDWPQDVCRDAWCGRWERNNGMYYWHLASDHGSQGARTHYQVWEQARSEHPLDNAARRDRYIDLMLQAGLMIRNVDAAELLRVAEQTAKLAVRAGVAEKQVIPNES